VQSLLRIPFIAKRRAFVESDEAQVVVRIVLDPSGALLRLELSAGSGFASLDQNALDTVRLAAPFGPLPTGTPSDKLDFDLPVQYVR
jgi:TonB family protein